MFVSISDTYYSFIGYIENYNEKKKKKSKHADEARKREEKRRENRVGGRKIKMKYVKRFKYFENFTVT